MEHWSERLLRVLRSRGWSYAELAKRSGVSREAIKKYVKGLVEKPRGRVLDKLAKALLVPTVWLREGRPEMEPDRSQESPNKLAASGVTSVLFPVRSEANGREATSGLTHLHVKGYAEGMGAPGSLGGSLIADVPKHYPRRGRPRKNPLPSELYHLSPGFQQGMHMSHQGSYSPASHISSLRGTSSSEGGGDGLQGSPASPLPSSGLASAQQATQKLPFETARSSLGQDPTLSQKCAVPVYDMSSLTRPLDIGRVEPLCWQTLDILSLNPLGRKISITNLFMTVVAGDSMSETLRHGDPILVDRSAQAVGADGIYMLHWSGGMLVKRLSVNPATHLIHVGSDNPRYASYDNVQPGDLHIVGRVMWMSRFF